MKIMNRLPILGSILIALAIIGCKTTTEPNTTVGNNQIQFASNANAVYLQNRLDTTNGTYGKDQIDPTSNDTISSVIVDTALTFQGKSPVVEMVNTHSNGSMNDTTYLYQDANGDLYRYNYGVESLNNNKTVTSFAQGPIQLGWVLQAKMDAAPGTTWNADNKTISLAGLPVAVSVTGTMAQDTTILVNGTSVAARHAVLNVNATSLLANANGVVDTYISTKYGMLLNVSHSTEAKIGANTVQSSGVETAMLRHN